MTYYAERTIDAITDSWSSIAVEPVATAGMTSNAIAPATLADNTLFDSNAASGSAILSLKAVAYLIIWSYC